MSATSAISRSTSSHHISHPSMSTLSHYGSAAAATDMHGSTSTPHLSHLRQSSSIGFDGLHHEHHSHYPTSAEGYDVYEEIGVGAFATVYRGCVKETGEPVAIKVIDLDQFNTNWEEIRREILIMSLVHHPNVVRILTSFVEQQDLWLLMPLAEGGSCAHIMKTIYPTGMKDEAMIATILREVLHGLLYFHKDGRLHRDLKAGNVLITAQGDVQLADFGVAGTLMENGDRKKARRTFTGTPCWMAPEVMEHAESGYDEKADIWSFGITALELAYGRAPYAKFPPMKVMVLTLQEEPPTADLYKDHSYEFSRHFHSMVSKCLRKEPGKRPNVKKLLEHKFFKAARDKAYLVEKIIRKMPVKRNQSGGKTINICELRHATLRDGGDGADDAQKPVSVGSWVFDRAQFDELKRQALEEKESAGPEGARIQSVQASYATHEDDTRHGRTGSTLQVPTSAPHARNSSAGSSHPAASSADESASASDGEEHALSDEDGHRPLPDFSDPNAGGGEAPTAAAPAVQRVVSPNEHLEGRFMVCDDEADGGDVGAEGGHEQGMDQYAQGGEYQQQEDGYYEQQQQQQGGGGPPLAHQSSSAFHNDAYVDEDANSQTQQRGEEDEQHETHVGRFAITDDGDEGDEQ